MFAKGERTAKESCLGPDAGQAHSCGGSTGIRASGCAAQLLSPARRHACIDLVRSQIEVSERRACRVLGQHRSTQRKLPVGRADEERLVADIIELARQFGRFGYRRITQMLKAAGWSVNHKRVERLWRLEGLKVPARQPKRGRLWLNDGSCVRLRAERPDHAPRQSPDCRPSGKRIIRLLTDDGLTTLSTIAPMMDGPSGR